MSKGQNKSVKSAIILACSFAMITHLFFINMYTAGIFLFGIPQIYRESKAHSDQSSESGYLRNLVQMCRANLTFVLSFFLYLMVVFFN
jgi:hypothetical protein